MARDDDGSANKFPFRATDVGGGDEGANKVAFGASGANGAVSLGDSIHQVDFGATGANGAVLPGTESANQVAFGASGAGGAVSNVAVSLSDGVQLVDFGATGANGAIMLSGGENTGASDIASLARPNGPPPAKRDAFLEEVKRRVERVAQPPLGLHLADWFREANALLAELARETVVDGKADPARVRAEPWMLLNSGIEHLLRTGSAAHTAGWIERACRTWWDSMSAYQADTGMPMDLAYRAMAGYVLARQKLESGDRGGALRWAALAHLADRLAAPSEGGGAEVVLTHGLGLSSDAIEVLNRVADPIAKSHANWSDPESFPEMCLTHAVDSDAGSPLVEASRSEHAICAPFLKRANEWAFVEPGPNDSFQKGARLELVAAYLTGTLPGVRSRRGFNSLNFSCEHDVVVSQRPGSINALPGGSTAMLVECKNWKDPVSVEPLGYFLARMKY